MMNVKPWCYITPKGHIYFSKSNPNHDEHGRFARGSSQKATKKKADEIVAKGVASKLRENLKESLKPYYGLHTNIETGIEANLSGKSVDKMSSEKAIQKTKENGFSVNEHFEVAKRIIELFENATLEKVHDDVKHGKPAVKIERFLSKPVVLSSGNKAQACITVKHSLDKSGRVIYSLEAMDIKNALAKTRAKGQLAKARLSNNSTISQSTEKSSINAINKSIGDKVMATAIFKRSSFDKYKVDDFYKRLKKSLSDTKFEYFKNKILQHLDKLERKENSDKEGLKKSLLVMEKAGYPVGTIREWKGKKYIKIAPGKWRPKYDSNTRGAKLAIAALKRKFASCTDSNELMKLVLENRDRFSDDNGKPLSFVRELSDYISELNDKIESVKKPEIVEYKKELEQKPVVKENLTTEKKGKLKILTKEETKDFIEKHKKSKSNERVSLGEITTPAKNRIKRITGIDVERVILDSDSIRHAYSKKEHNLEPNDLDDMFDIINTTTDISLSEKNNKGGNKVIVFKKQETNGVILCEEYRAGKRELELQTAYRLEKNQQPHGADKQLPANVRNATAPDSTISQSGKKSSGIDVIRDKYTSSKSIDGDEDEINVGKEVISGKWKLVEADAPSASHDEKTFYKTEGFPTNADGSTINDRDYEHDKDAQEAVRDIASDFDGRAVSFDSPVVVSTDGVVISGNNRTMSSKLAAQKGTDTKYIETLKKRAKKFGFTTEQVESFKNPRVVFETDVSGKYSTAQFAKFNESGKKAMNVVEKAVKISKTVNTDTISNIAEKMSEFETLGDLYKDKKATQDIFNILIQNNVIQKTDLSAYYTDDGGISESGKEFIETVLIGSVVNENNIRQLSTEGGKGIRQKLVRAITPLVENKGMGGYSINSELNEAVAIAVEVKKNPDTFRSVEDYANQPDMFKKIDPVAVKIAKKLEGTQKQFADFMLEINGGLRSPANGEYDIFLGGIESKTDVLNRFLQMKKSQLFIAVKKSVFNNLMKALEG